jgi:hypothetical protein
MTGIRKGIAQVRREQSYRAGNIVSLLERLLDDAEPEGPNHSVVAIGNNRMSQIELAIALWNKGRQDAMDLYPSVYRDYAPVRWLDLVPGSIVYIDEFESALYPQANPQISGPYSVVGIEPPGIALTLMRGGRKFNYIGNALLRKKGGDAPAG